MTGKELYTALYGAVIEGGMPALPPWRDLRARGYAVLVLAADALSADAEPVDYTSEAIQEREDGRARRLYEAHCRLDVMYSHSPWEHLPEGADGWGRSYWRQLAEVS